MQADVWKSLPKHFCKFCKCWIADNRPSRDFHEKGKKHQENVQLKIKEVRKKSVQDEKKKSEENSYMIEMEEAAKKAFLKDLKGDPKLAKHYLEKAKAKKQTVEDAKKKKVEDAKKKDEAKIQETKASSSGKSASVGTWHVTYSPDGYPYYWNDNTAEVSWTVPEGVEVADDTGQTDLQSYDNPCAGEENNDETVNKNSEQKMDSHITSSEQRVPTPDMNVNNSVSTTVRKAASSEEKIVEPKIFDSSDISLIPLPGDITLPMSKDTSENESSTIDEPIPPGETSAPPPLPPMLSSKHSQDKSPEPNQLTEEGGEEADDDFARTAVTAIKRAHDSAYGQWEQIVHEEPEQVDLQLPKGEEHFEPQVVVVSEPKFKIRHKKIDTLGAGLVEFKKRKMNSRNLKQRGDS